MNMKQGRFPAVLSLASLDGRYGFKIDGEVIGDDSCSSGISNADINGDGLTDLLIGAVGSAECRGRGYVIFGSSNIGSNGSSLLSSLDGKNGFKLDGENRVDYSGFPITVAGDINGDGYSDFLIGALNYNNGTGRSYLIFGGKNIGSSGLIPLSSLNGNNGFKIDGENSGDWSGHSLAGIDDINGDGYADFVIGAHIHNNFAGRSYVVFGGHDIVGNDVLFLSNLNGRNGFKLDGESAHDQSGVSVSSTGDINNDGYPDLLIGADNYLGGAAVGRSYVIFGGPEVGSEGTILLSSLNGAQGFKLDGETSNDWSGYSYSIGMPGDVNGDGITDIVIGAFGHNKNTGRSYVVFGGSDIGSNAVFPLSSLNGTNGFKLDGENTDDQSGRSVSIVGDINGDGYEDLMIGAWHYNNSKGRSYVVFGGSDVGKNGIISLSNLMGDNGFKLDGESNGDAVVDGYSVGAVGDVNNDRVDDFYVGACAHAGTGRTYVIFGDVPPVLVSNQLNISVGASVQINASYLSAYDFNHNNDTLVFIPSGVIHGRFESTNNSGVSLANFTQQSIRNGEIQFVHDGTLFAPNYSIAVDSGGIANVGSTLAKITFIKNIQPSAFPAVVPLSSLNGKTGFKIDGEAAGHDSGSSVSSAGDINGDGITDITIGALKAFSQAGRSYVVFGNSEIGNNGSLSLINLNGTNGFKLGAEGSDDWNGIAVSHVDDFNNDGYDDLLIGAVEASPNGVAHAGRSYIVYGGPKISGNGLFALSNLNGANGFRLDGEYVNDESGVVINPVGDVNGDGYPDIGIGAVAFNWQQGRSYIVFGSSLIGKTGDLPLSSLNGQTGFKLDGEEQNDQSGYWIGMVGDINDDGIVDLIVGAPGYKGLDWNGMGRCYVIFGKIGLGSNGNLPLSSINGINGFKLDGEVSGDYFGFSIGGCISGDVNGDGISDFIMGAPGHNSLTGRSYVIFGGLGIGSSGSLALSSLNGRNGFKIDGETVGDASGFVTNLAGDINADGYIDLVIGAYGYNNKAGRIYLVFGGPEVGNSGLISLADLNGINGIKLDGEAPGDYHNDYTGSVSAAGDVNHDGIDDLLIGASGHNSNTGRTYVVFGDVAPQFIVGLLTIHQNQTIILNNQDLNATDFNHPDAGLRFNVTDVQHGYFSLVNSTGQTVTSFNQSQIWNGQMQFVHDDSLQAPNYTIQVQSDGLALPPSPQTANISFYRRPVLLQNNLLIHQSETVLITTDNLNVTDDYPSDQVLFTIRNLQHGQFQLVPALPVSQFNQQQLLAQKVLFVQDSSASTPSYQVTVSDPYFTLPTDTVNMIFYRRPVIENNQLVIHQGETVKMTTSLLNVTDDYPDDEVVFTMNNVQQGHFQLTPTNATITQFTQKQLESDQVWFVQEGSANAPSYQVGVNDPYFTLPPVSTVTTTFYRQPFITVNQLLIHQGETVVMTASQLNGVDDYAPSQIIFTTDQIEHGKFQLLPSNSTVQQFTRINCRPNRFCLHRIIRRIHRTIE